MLIVIILVMLLLICLITDLKSRRILNTVTLPTILFGIVYNIITTGTEGFIFGGKGFLVGLGLLFIPYLLGGIGAGDVKLMAAIGALMGAGFVFYSFIYTALIGGVIALILIIKTYGLKSALKSFFFKMLFLKSSMGSMNFTKDNTNGISFPYGVAIVLGTFCTLIWGGF